MPENQIATIGVFPQAAFLPLRGECAVAVVCRFLCFGEQMKALEEKIVKEGTVLPGDVLKVGSFLNQQIDTVFLKEMAKETGAKLNFISDVETAVKGADVIYTDVWVSMGEPFEEWQKRIDVMKPYQVSSQVMEWAGEQAIFMHCLPAFHDLKTKIGRQIKEQFGMDELEVTDEVFEGPRSVVFDEAENRMHTIKAVMYELMK